VTVIVGGWFNRAPASSPGGAGAPAGVPRLAAIGRFALTADESGRDAGQLDLELSRAILHNSRSSTPPWPCSRIAKDLHRRSVIAVEAAGANDR